MAQEAITSKQTTKQDIKKLEPLTDRDWKLFGKIACDIKKNSDRYCEAGKWLDDFYDENEYCYSN